MTKEEKRLLINQAMKLTKLGFEVEAKRKELKKLVGATASVVRGFYRRFLIYFS